MGRPPSDLDEYLDWQQRLASFEASGLDIGVFCLKEASPVEIQLPNGGVVRLPLGVGQAVLVETIRTVGALRPWKAPKS